MAEKSVPSEPVTTEVPPGEPVITEAPPGEPATTDAPPGEPVITEAPPSYQDAVSRTSNLDYVDFIPVKVSKDGAKKQFEPFDVLVRRGNEWLASNSNKKVLTCESVEINIGYDGELKTNESTWVEMSKSWQEEYVRILRLWIVDRGSSEVPEPQQIGYVNVVPLCISGTDFFQYPEFVSYPDTVAAFNMQLQQRPLPGKILNVETQEMKYKKSTGEIDPDASHWKEGEDKSSYFVYVTRVFYAIGVTWHEQIGSVDFVPSKINGVFEDMPSILNRAHVWVTQQTGINVTNVQSINYKVISRNYASFLTGGKLNTSLSSYREDDDGITKFVRILRIYFTRLVDDSGHLVTDVPTALTVRNFLPAQTEGGPGFCETFEFEDLIKTKERLASWFKVSGARPLSAESVPVLKNDDLLTIEEVNRTVCAKDGGSMKSYMNIYRVFFREPYFEPPAHLLPPLPEIKRGDNVCYLCCCCCCIACYHSCKDDEADGNITNDNANRTGHNV